MTKHSLIRLTEVMSRVGWKKSTISKYVNEGRFPDSYPIGDSAVGWLESEVDEWIVTLIETSRQVKGGTK